MTSFQLNCLALADMDAAARVMRKSFDQRLPWLSGLHTPDEDTQYFRDILYPRCAVWGGIVDGELSGIVAFRDAWIDQLYILPDCQSRGLGTALLDVAKSHHSYLQLWAFQRNVGARRFYERRGFRLVEETDGSRNEEKEPDVRYEWRCAEG